MSDEERRELERKDHGGDPEARLKLERLRCREGKHCACVGDKPIAGLDLKLKLFTFRNKENGKIRVRLNVEGLAANAKEAGWLARWLHRRLGLYFGAEDESAFFERFIAENERER